jgi:thymidine kinase
MSQQASGYLELFIGPMFSGKTSKLIELYKQYKFCNIPVLVINHSIDNRYTDSTNTNKTNNMVELSSHDKITIPCLQTEKLLDIEVNFETNIILINEGQFFTDLYQFTILMLEQNKTIYISGLDGDFKRQKFGEILDLIPLCDKVTKMQSLCSLCKNGCPGIFSLRLTKDIEQTLIGIDNYIPVCRKCYMKTIIP